MSRYRETQGVKSNYDHAPQAGFGRTTHFREGPGVFAPLPVTLPDLPAHTPIIEQPTPTPQEPVSVPDAGAFHLVAFVLFGAVIVRRWFK
jgi:hypothetical protein